MSEMKIIIKNCPTKYAEIHKKYFLLFIFRVILCISWAKGYDILLLWFILEI